MLPRLEGRVSQATQMQAQVWTQEKSPAKGNQGRHNTPDHILRSSMCLGQDGSNDWGRLQSREADEAESRSDGAKLSGCP